MATNPLEDNILSANRVDKNPADFVNYSNVDWSLERSWDCMREKSEKVSDEVLDLLPCDPFGMDLGTTVATFSGWLEDAWDDLESSLPCDPFGMDLRTPFTVFGGFLEGMGEDLELNSIVFSTCEQVDVSIGEDQLFSEVNFVWDGSFDFHSQIDDFVVQEASIFSGEHVLAGLCGDSLVSDSNLEKLTEFCQEGSSVANGDNSDTYADVAEGGPPHDGLLFCLNYLGVKNLFSVERVCKSLRDAVQCDPLLWKRICIDYPLNLRIDDNALVQLTDRAQGALECLVLVACIKITDIGLGQVLRRNPRLSKLSVPGCRNLSIDGILSNLRDLKSMGKLGIKVLRIIGIDDMTKDKFEELNSLLGADSPSQLHTHEPWFFCDGPLYLSCEDNRIIDIEKCPMCGRYKQVYDCTRKSCSTTAQSCRGCRFCIARCICCGCCIMDCSYVETILFDLTCLPCWRRGPNYCYWKEKSVETRSPDYIVRAWESCRMYLHG